MSTDERSENSFPPEIDAVYEARASEEEEYREVVEEEVVEVIEADDPATAKPRVGIVEEHVEIVIRAEEDLNSGEADDPPIRKKSA